MSSGVLYVVSNYNQLFAVDIKTRKQLWTYTMEGFVSSPPLISNNMVYLRNNDGKLHAIDGKTGSRIWNRDIEAFRILELV